MKKRFSMRNKLLVIFGLLIILTATIEGILAVQTARTAVTEKIETHLKDKAADTAEIINGRIIAFHQFLEGIARIPVIRDTSVPYAEKTNILINQAKFNPVLKELYIVDTKGIQYYTDGTTETYTNDLWFKEALKGKNIQQNLILIV